MSRKYDNVNGKQEMEERKVIGIDLGGTKIKFGVVTEDGDILGREISLPTESSRPSQEIVNTIDEGIKLAIQSADISKKEIAGIGIGSPGPLDVRKGIILKAPNLPTMNDFPLKKAVEEATGLPVKLNNDGNCFVLGEAFFGVGKGKDIVCGVTLGTGLGFGIVFNKKIYMGATGTAAEIWCSPYGDKIFEEYGSARTISRLYKKRTGDRLTAIEIYRLAQQNNRAAIDTFHEFGSNLGEILSILTNVLDPDVLVIGGSVSNSWEFFQISVTQNILQHINEEPRRHLQIVRTSLGDSAGLLGAAALIFS
ncbi:MAG: ROK family protein [Calditrichaeota bacterium]|nr:ROK family protein [Calditrichota bacterium]